MAYRPPHRRSPAPGLSQAEGIAPPAAPKPNPYAQAWSRGQSPLPPVASPPPPPNSSRPSFRHPAPSAAASTQGNRPAPTNFAGGGSASFPSVRRPATDTFGVGGGGGSRAMDRTGRGVYGGGGGYGGDGRTGPGPSARGGGAGIGRVGMRLAAPRKNTPKPDDMELLASVSRSGGDDADGDALKDYSTQERFRAYIDGRIRRYHNARGEPEEQENLGTIVRLFRKLREGVVASHRLDEFAIEVFEDSVRYAVLAHDVPQLNAALNGLVPDLYRAVDCARARGKDTSAPVWTPGQGELLSPARSASAPPVSPMEGERNHRAHFASLLLLYHLVHSSRAVYQTTLEELTLPARGITISSSPALGLEEGMSALSLSTTRTVLPPHEPTFTSPSLLAFARAAAHALAPETFNPRAFAFLVSPPSAVKGADAPEALERALLAWAAPRVRDRSGALLRKAYVGTNVPWAAALLGVSEAGVEMWALAQGLGVKDGVVKLR